MKKRVFSIVFAMLIMLAVVPVAAFADGTDIETDINDMYITRFAVETVNVSNDAETVQVSVSIKSNGGFAGVTYLLEYDTTALTLETQPVFGGINGFSYEAGPLSDGGHIGMISSVDNVYDTGVLLTYTFRINPEAESGFYEVDFITKGTVETLNGGTQELCVLDENLVAVKSDSVSGGVVIPGYTVYYDANGGSGAPDSQYKPKNGSVTISDGVPAKEGNVFLGWATSSTATEIEYVAGENYSVNADLTLYAVWKEVAGTIDINVATVKAEPGEEVEVAISLENHPGFGGVELEITYDNTKLEYLSGEAKMPLLAEVNPDTTSQNKIKVFATAANNVTASGEFVSLKFKVSETAEDGLCNISVQAKDFYKYIESKMVDLVPNVTNGGVRVMSEITGDINLDETVNADDVVLLLNHLSGGDVISYKGSLDFNGDGEVDEGDAVALLRFVLFPDNFSIEEASLSSETSAVYTVESKTGYTGEEIEISVSLESPEAFRAAGFANISYDEAAFTLNSCTVEPEFGALTSFENVSDMIFVAVDENEIASFSGNVLKLNFTIKEDAAPGSYTITGIPGLANTGKIEASVNSGVITVKDISEKPVIPVSGVSLDTESVLLGIGDNTTLTAVLTPVDATTGTELTWESSNEDVATVEDGVVTAVSKGTAKITVRTENGKSATCSVTVGVRADAVNFTTLKFTSLAVGKTMSFKASAVCENGTKPLSAKVVYSIVEGAEYAEIDAKGKLTALDFGEVVVRATAEFGTETAYDEVTIRICVPATKVTINKTKAAMALGCGDLQLEAVMTAKEECTDTLTWESSDEEIVTVDENGLVTAHAVGKAKVTALAGSGKSATCSITVGVPADAVEFTSLKSTSLSVGKTLSLKAKAYRTDGEKPVSANAEFEIIEGAEYAEIDAKGKLKGLGIGEVVVRARAEAGTEEAFADITINVCILATKVTLNTTKAAMTVGGEDLELIAEMLPLDNTDTLTWESSDEDIATVEEVEKGVALVTAHAAGKVKVTALTGSGMKATCSITIGIPADTVEFTTDDYTALAVGKTLTLKAKAYREDGEKPVSTNVVYEIVEGEDFAELDAKGKLKGLGIGEVVVRARAEAGTEEAFAEITINVCIPATKVTLNKTKAAMAYGEGDLVLVAETLPLDNTDTLTWESSDEEIAVVEEIEEGVAVVTALNTGKVKITAITGSGKKATCSVTIGLAADTVEFSSLKATSVAVGKTITLKAKASRNIDDEKPVSTNVEFEIIEGEEFAEIDAKGKLKGIEEGYVTVRAWAEAGTEDAYEDVVIKVCVPATKVTVYPTKTEMAVGEDMYLEAEMISSVGDCTDDLFWTTSDEEIATVDEDGLVTAHSEGSVKITATSGSGKKATCTIKVVEAPEEPEVPEEPEEPVGTFQELVLHDLSYEFIEDPFIIEANPGAIGGMEIRATVVAPSNVKDVLIAEWGTGISDMSPEEIQETAELYAAMWKEHDIPIMTDTQTPFEIITAHPVGEGEIDSHPQVLLIGLDEDYNAVGYYIVDPDGYVVE